MSAVVLLYSTFPSLKEARNAAKKLIAKRLAACANISKENALYRWKGKLEDCTEYSALFKTTPAKAVAAVKELERVHPYEVPCIMRIPCSAGRAFGRWVAEETKSKKWWPELYKYVGKPKINGGEV